MLALACDYRIMYGGHDESTVDGKKKHLPTIGFNETQLGMYVLIIPALQQIDASNDLTY